MMTEFSTHLLNDIRGRFAHIDRCPQQGPRVFFENAGGTLTLNTVVETSANYAAIPDNQGRDNLGSQELGRVINKAKEAMRVFMNAKAGQFFVGESGTELIFRLLMNACLGTGADGIVLGSTIEHPATRSAAARWAPLSGKTHSLINHSNELGLVTAESYAEAVTPNTKVATILHTSPVTGMGMDVAGISAAIRAVSPDCFIIVDGIQHAAHGQIDLAAYDIDGYVISPYKMFSRHGYGIAWISDRMSALPHDCLDGGPSENWELGTRDTGAYAATSAVISYIEWLGGEVSDNATGRRDKFIAAGKAIGDHEQSLTDALIYGAGNLAGLAEMDDVQIIGGADNPAREGLVSIVVDGMASVDVVAKLNAQGIRTHLRKPDHYSASVLEPLGLDGCIRASMCHYNSKAEVAQFLAAMKTIKN